MKRTAKKLMSLGLAIALVLVGATYSTSTVDAKGKGGKHSWKQEKQKDSKAHKGKKDKKSKKHSICTGSAVVATGGACYKGVEGKKDKIKPASGCALKADKIGKSKCKLFKIKKKVTVKDENVLVIKCKNKVTWKNAAVEVTNEENDAVEAKITKKTKKKVKIEVSGLEKEEKYTVTITGVKTNKEKKYGLVTTTFTTGK